MCARERCARWTREDVVCAMVIAAEPGKMTLGRARGRAAGPRAGGGKNVKNDDESFPRAVAIESTSAGGHVLRFNISADLRLFEN